MNPTKIGNSTVIASFIPRRLSSTSTTMNATSAASLYGWKPIGNSENSASTPLAIEIEMVST